MLKRLGTRRYAIVLAWILLTAWPQGETQATRNSPGEAIRDVTADGAWCWFADPRAVYYEGKQRGTYVGWVTRAGDIQVAFRAADTNRFRVTTVRENLDPDDHANPALLSLPDGRLTAFYSGHGGEHMFYRTTVNPEDVSSWEPEREVKTNTAGEKGYTYPNPYRLSGENDRIYLFWRGGNFKPAFAASDDGGHTWTDAQTVIEGPGQRPYVKYASDGRESIHLAFTDGHPRNEPSNGIYYAKYRDGAFYRADGSKIAGLNALPFKPSAADLVYDADAAGARGWVWDIALDGNGYPVIVYAAFPTETDHRYRYAYWNGTRWEDHLITEAGSWFPQTATGEVEREPHYSGGVVLDHADPSVVYLSRPVNGVFEIEQWVTHDHGASWASTPITERSDQPNVRPFVPRGSARDIQLMWMYGDYIHYTQFHTALRMKLIDSGHDDR
ncbi:MAG: hypothetical protein GEU99_02625 [Luteitalea sp.]|nr:hypothetical protein [Luteitalea sp.]